MIKPMTFTGDTVGSGGCFVDHTGIFWRSVGGMFARWSDTSDSIPTVTAYAGRQLFSQLGGGRAAFQGADVEIKADWKLDGLSYRVVLEHDSPSSGLDDDQFLEWIYNRLVVVHGEKPNYDYMARLRGMVDA